MFVKVSPSKHKAGAITSLAFQGSSHNETENQSCQDCPAILAAIKHKQLPVVRERALEAKTPESLLLVVSEENQRVLDHLKCGERNVKYRKIVITLSGNRKVSLKQWKTGKYDYSKDCIQQRQTPPERLDWSPRLKAVGTLWRHVSAQVSSKAAYVGVETGTGRNGSTVHSSFVQQIWNMNCSSVAL